MSRMNGRNRKKVYDYLVQRDGEQCFIGTNPGNEGTLVVDHWDNNNENNAEDNLHLLCRSCNNVKNSRGVDHRSKSDLGQKMLSPVCVCVCVSDEKAKTEPGKTLSAEFLKNQRAEPAFRHWLFYNIVKLSRITYHDAIHSGAEVSKCSQETIKRYIGKVISVAGMYGVIEEVESGKKIIELKPEWATFRAKLAIQEQMRKYVNNWKKA